MAGHRPFSELRDGMTPEQRAAADTKVQALAAQPVTYTLRLTAIGSATGVCVATTGGRRVVAGRV